MTKPFDGEPVRLTAADIGEEEPVQLTAEDVGEEAPVQLTYEDVGEEEPVQLTAEDIGEEEPVQLTEEEASAADRSKPGFLRRAVSETLTQLADVGRQAAAGVVRDLPRMLWQTAAAVLPGETPSAKNPQGSGLAGFAGQTVDEIDYREQEAKWDDPLRSGAAGLPGMAARSLAPNLLAALATRGASVKAMPFVYGTARGQDVFRRMRDQADAEGTPFDATAARLHAFGAGGLEGGLEYVSNLFGLGKAAKEFGAALKAGNPVFDETLSKGLAGALRKVAGEMLAEGGTEFVQEGGGELHEQLMGISDALEGKPESILDVDWRAVAEAAALGAGAGALAAGAAGGMAKASQSLGARMANSRELRDALKASTGAAEEAERGTGDGGQETVNGGRGTDGQTTDQGAPGGEQPADGQDIGGGAAAGAEGGAPLQTRAEMMPEREDGGRIDAIEERQTADGRTVSGVRMLMPDGKGLWNPDPAEVAMAEYWIKDRMLFPPAPAGDKGRQAGDPRVNASLRAGFDVKPGKSVLINIGKSQRAYTAKVVEVLDDTHVRVRVDKTARSVKNGRDGYLDLDVRQLKEFSGVVKKRENAEKLNRLDPEQRKRVRDDAREFDEILLRGDEIAEQRVIDAANLIGGDEGRRMAQEERVRAYERARSLLGVEGDLQDPVERAAARPKLREFVSRAQDTARRQELGEAVDTPEAVWMQRFMQDARDEADALESEPFALDSLTPDELEADKRRVATAQQRIAQRRKLEERAAAPMTGTAGDMTGSLPGFEGTSDVPLFTEQGGGKQQVNTPDWTAFAESAANRMWSQYESARLRRDNGKRGKNTSDYRREWETVMRIADRFGIDRKEAEEFLTPHIMSSLNGKQEFFEGVRQAARKKVSETGKGVLANEETGLTAGVGRDYAGGVNGERATRDISADEIAKRDAEYLEALNSGKRHKAASILVRALGVKFADASYDRGGTHDAPDAETGSPSFDVTFNRSYPDDFYDSVGLRYYGTGETWDGEGYNVLMRLKGHPDGLVTVYRAVDKDSKTRGIQPGDWVTTVRRYADEHGKGNIKGGHRIQSKIVRAKDIFTNGDSFLEWGYHPQPKGTFPRVVKRDAAGNIIPLSKRLTDTSFEGDTGEDSGSGDVLANEEADPALENRASARPDGVTSIGGVRITPHTTYNQDESAGMDGATETQTPVSEGLKGVQMDLRDAVALYRELRGMIPRIRQRLRGSKVLGWYTIKGREIELLASAFGLVDKKDVANIRARLTERGMNEAAVEAQLPNEIHALVEIRRNQRMKMPVKLMTHELGHLIDALPDDALRGRGNILGHVAALKRYLKQTLPREPGAPEEVTAEEKRRLWSEAERMAERDIGKAREFIEEIKTEIKELHALPVSAEDIKGLLGLNGKEETPELYAWFARQDDATKKDILKQAMKGIVDERAAGGAVREITRVVSTGTRIRTEKGYSRADVAKRFKELLRKAVEDLQLIERKRIVAEARAAIPKWRGADQWEKYFDRPEEMYAELFGMYLSDPAFLEQNCPTVFRAFVAYREARPEVAKAYNQWLHDMQDGTRNRKHMAALTESMTNAADMELKEAEKAMKSQTFTQEWQAIRFALDTRNGPIYVAVRKAYKWNLKQLKGDLKSGNITREQFGDAKNELRRRRYDVYNGMKHIAHGIGEVRTMSVDVNGRVKAKLDAAGIEWITFDTYAALNRIRYELQGRAAPGGIMPDSAKEMIDELTAGMSEGQKAALSEAWNEYRKIWEDNVIEAEGTRNLFGDELHELLRKNKYYVTFRHRPTREDIKSLMEERRKAGEDAVKEGMAFADGTTRFDIMASAIEHGMGSLGAKIYPLTGSFDPIASATVQTLQLGCSILHAVNLNNAKMRLRAYLVDYKYAGFADVKIERAKDGSPRVSGIDESRFGVVYYSERGEIKAYKTDKWIAKAFESHQSDGIRSVQALMKINNAMAGLQTRLRYGFWEPAYAKDRQATVAHTPGMWRSPLAALPGVGETPIAYLTRFIPPKVIQSFPKWMLNDRMFEYWESTGWRAAALLEKGNLEAQLKTADELESMGRLDKADQLRKEVLLVRRAMKLGITMQQQDLIPPTVGATPLDRHLMRYGLTQEIKRDSENFVKDTVPRILKSIFAKYEKMGEQRENSVKIATLAFLDKNRPDLTDEQKMVMVSDWGGSPDFSERGVWAKNIEFMSGSFLNARKEGLKRSFSALEDHPLDFVAKKMAYSVGPAITRAALATGLASYVLKHMIPDDDERENNTLWKFAEFCRKAYSHVSDYLQKSYAVIPLPVDLDGKGALVMTLPLDETDMAWNDIAYTLVESICEEWGFDGHSGLKSPTPLSEMVSRQISNFLPTTANGGMLLGAIMPFINTYGLGKQTYDEFRQRNVLTQDEMDARFRTDDALGVLMGYAYNSSVGGLIKRWERPDQATMSMGKLHDFLNAEFVQPSVGRFLRVVSNGQQQMADAALYDAEMAKVDARLEAKRVLRESLKQGVYLAPEFNEVVTKNPYILDYYQREYTEAVEKRQKRSTPFLTNAMKTDNPAAFGRLMDMHGNYQ